MFFQNQVMPAERIFYLGDSIGDHTQGRDSIMESHHSHQAEIEGSIQQSVLDYTKDIKWKSQYALCAPRQANGIANVRARSKSMGWLSAIYFP